MGFADIKAGADSPALVRRTLEAVAFLAPLSVDMPESLTDDKGALKPLPTGYIPVGLVTVDGFKMSQKVDKSETEALGYVDPVRTDITKAPKEVTFEIMESGRKALDELIWGVDLSAVTPGANGEVAFDLPAIPVMKEYRLVVVSRDIDPTDATKEWLDAWGFPRVKPAELPDKSFSSKDDARTYELTFDVLSDKSKGTAMRVYSAGSARGVAENQVRTGYATGTPATP